MWPIITDHLHIVLVISAHWFWMVLVSSAQVMDLSLNDTVRAGSLSTNWKSFLMWFGERRQTVPLWLEWLCVCVTRVVWERLGTAGRWVQGYKDCFPCEKRSTSDGKLRKCFCQAEKEEGLFAASATLKSERFHARLATSAVLLICAASKPFRRARLSPPRARTEMPSIFPSLRPVTLLHPALLYLIVFFLNLKVSSLLFIFHRMK